MPHDSLAEEFSDAMRSLRDSDAEYVPLLVDLLLQKARDFRASDVHLVPQQVGLKMQLRIDGVLHHVASFDGDVCPRIVARLKVLAGLLTYRTDVPQEGRISSSDAEGPCGEIRVTTFPTLFGEKAAVRLFAGSDHYQRLNQLGLPEDVEGAMGSLLQSTSGVILLTGPSGSGKTTTVYACLRELVRLHGDGKGLMSLEDPIEVVVSGVTQSQVRPHVGFDLATGIKSMMRQDPDVIMIGEIRDPETAECAFQAALTGHLVLTTFHAGSAVEAVTRLLDMGIEPYLISSTLRAVVCQRLFRKACSVCLAQTATDRNSAGLSEPTNSADNSAADETLASRCRACGGIRYHGRFVTAELLDPHGPGISQALLERVDARQLETIAKECGMVTLQDRGRKAVRSGLTYPEEVFRVLGRSV
ncbi:MAG: type II/IV secretion system protein [Fuerstiella sp.]|nr:type II/IV secretion system protein [Fuerstiella sp.]MCP4786358.1 type II/IV secretion system protein [Fuerstiella sp.]MCP4858334.1 type II/IV secretion system protein [Fuerstiella sp.]